jgi:hypothetical protein
MYISKTVTDIAVTFIQKHNICFDIYEAEIVTSSFGKFICVYNFPASSLAGEFIKNGQSDYFQILNWISRFIN